MIGFKSKLSKEGIDTLRQGIIGDMALGILYGKSSKFFTENYEKGYINDKFGAIYEVCAKMYSRLRDGGGCFSM